MRKKFLKLQLETEELVSEIQKNMSLDLCSDIQKVFKQVCYCKNSIGYELQLLSFRIGERKGRRERNGRESGREREKGRNSKGKAIRVWKKLSQLVFRSVSQR